MGENQKVFKILSIIIVAVVSILIVSSIIYMRIGCRAKNCIALGISTIIFLLWVVAFWFAALHYYSKK